MSDHSLSFSKKGISSANKLICLSLVAIALLMLDSRYAAVQNAKRYVATALYPLQWLANQPIEWYEYSSALFQSQNYLLAENQRLTLENTQLKMRTRQAEIQLRELNDVKSLLSLKQKALSDGLAAEVISNGREPVGSRLVINKGSNHHIQVGDAVVDDAGLIGQVSQVHPISAEISPLTDGSLTIPVMVMRTGMRTLVYGGSGSLTLRYFPTDSDLQPNDVLITSGLDSIYPAGIPVARVMQTSRNAGTPFYRVQLEPIAALHRSKFVLILPQQPVQAASAPVSAPITTP
ncbi:rod shape-determining protein MreC [Kingella kingae]|uniref:Cell shape-determining protein MreC n=2 Tax=Kingella kingae TaxID=504 RepID=F5S8D9_KINKI|nr:rod shape-determining protein MreC [Kingella kingae]EGK08180.1 rod shape-determining protein MreC [Kingella kingae ATCC 23330]MDK4527649.1 rod shape-determining protein MreC [Kingella kingae]MDK4533641.1 rod shape-determining protein MreC [Kingella kingae]MDK4540150.1 rod shape-determining protein MreC [Kingella kingae]MDK4542229.1 rod shape-determining protein MreC [Kingella kingae]